MPAKDGRINNGGNTSAGRKPVAEEKHVKNIIQKALKQFYKIEDDEGAQVALILDLLTEKRTKRWVAERFYGKPKETVESTVNLPLGSLKIESKGQTPKTED